MSIIKYSVKFKRTLLININDKGKMGQVRVGEVTHFQQCPDGSLDIVAQIWPQTPDRIKKEIEKNPGMLGMRADAQPVNGALIFKDGTEIEEVANPDYIDPAELKKEIETLKNRLDNLINNIGGKV